MVTASSREQPVPPLPIGIVLFSWLATQCRVAAMLDSISWRQILGVGMLGGIAFTMSLFIANLAFGESPALETAKVGIWRLRFCPPWRARSFS